MDGVQRTFSNYELSFLYFETYDGIRGRGLLDLARESIALDTMAQRYGKKFYQNGARLSGIVEVDTDANKETRTRVKGEFSRFAAEDMFAVAVLDVYKRQVGKDRRPQLLRYGHLTSSLTPSPSRR